MNLSRRVILIAVLVVASAVSLGLAATAQANIVRDLNSDCQAKGGTWTEGVEGGKGFARCDVRTCKMKMVLIGAILIYYPNCATTTTEIRWSL